MPMGKGTYGKIKGRPPKAKPTKLTAVQKKKIMAKKK